MGTKIIRCCIVDDEPLALGLIESYVKKTPFLELVGKYSNAVQAMEVLQNSEVDLLFLDIQMPELNGIEFSKLIIGNTRVIFTTAFSEYALDGFKVNALDYLLKPFSYGEFLKAAQRALEWFEHVTASPITQSAQPTPDFIYVKADYKMQQIELKQILYIEGLKDYVKIVIEDQTHSILSLMSMKSMEELLPSNDFIRVHRSYIVRADKVKIIERNRIVFGKVYIPISDSYKENFFEKINKRAIWGA